MFGFLVGSTILFNDVGDMSVFLVFILTHKETSFVPPFMVYSWFIIYVFFLLNQEFIFLNSNSAKNTSVSSIILFVFRRTWVVDRQSRLKFLQLIQDFLSSGNKFRSFAVVAEWLVHSALVPLLKIEKRVRFPRSPNPCRLSCQTHKSDYILKKLTLNRFSTLFWGLS